MASRLGGRHKGEPGKLAIMDSETGKVVQVVDSTGGADEIFYDGAMGRVYVFGTTGNIAVFKQKDADHYELLGKVPSGAIAKTGLWVPELKRLYAAVPKHIVLTPPREKVPGEMIDEDAHLMVFETLP
jgi:hypothetical protein